MSVSRATSSRVAVIAARVATEPPARQAPTPDSIARRLLPALILAAACGQPAPAPDPVPVHDSFTLVSAALGEARTINVYLPSSYRGDDTSHLPVLYMPDGGIDEDFPHLANSIDSAIRVGAMRPLVLVGVANTERRRDMTGPTVVASDSAVAPRIGGSATFRRFFADELLPAISARYRVTDERGIIGESLAGYFIVETLLAEPALFEHYIALSPSLWWNAQEQVKRAGERLRAAPGTTAKLTLSSANEGDIVPAVAALADSLRASAPIGLSWKYVPHPELRHDNIYRRAGPAALVNHFPAGTP